MTKEVLFVVPGAGDETVGRPALIEEDTTVADLLRAADLNPSDWQVQVMQGDEPVSLASDDKLAQHVKEGAKVFAIPPMVVGLAS